MKPQSGPSTPTPPTDVIRRRMQTQRRRDTSCELNVRRRLHAQGRRYRVDVRPEADLRIRGDIVWKGRRIVVFIDGCFWHGCPIHGTQPKKNSEWWQNKLRTNVDRDRATTTALRERGWTVLRFWEHEDVEAIVQRITEVLDIPD